jgi:cytochrome c oxidase subunit 1
MPAQAARWLFSTNAKDIGTLYLVFGVFTGLLGTAFSILVRMELSAPGSQLLAGDHQLYNVLATTHGIMMIYFMVVPTMAGFANYMAPVLVGAPDNNLLCPAGGCTYNSPSLPPHTHGPLTPPSLSLPL